MQRPFAVAAAGLLALAILSAPARADGGFQLGVEVLLQQRTDLVEGKRIGLITNPTGVNQRLESDIDLLYADPRIKLVALFGPEHGVRGGRQAGADVASYTDPATGVPVYSLYGKTRKPTPAMLKNVDVLVFDIQAVGTRYYTYLYTLAYAMQAAAEKHIPFIVLDRPNPLGGLKVQGPVLEPEQSSFVGLYPIALRYGMTIGELARLFNDEFHIGADLTVVKMHGWKRWMYFDDTPLQFVMPSPNMPTLTTALVYPGLGLIEGTNVSEGRGTTRPFELIGAPWINAEALARALNAENVAGVRFRPAYFTPTFSKYHGEPCAGVQVHVMNRNAFNPVVTGLSVIKTIHDNYPHKFAFKSRHFDHLIGNSWVRKGIESGVSIAAMRKRWQKSLKRFEQERKQYLLY